MEKKKILDLRYNEMWNDWEGANESLQESDQNEHGQLVLSWKRLNVSVKKITQTFFESSRITYKQILYNVSGNVQCGSLLGIMGPSGSGKTTLVATISHRTKGNFEGELLLNGHPVSEDVMIKISGFVPQHDISFEHLTVSEHLFLMATLKMDRYTTKSTLNGRIDYVVTILVMNRILDTRLLFLSGGERKKVALAVQLLNDPPILFCDEITTDGEKAKRNVDEMCKWSSADIRIDLNYGVFNNQIQLDYTKHLQTQKPLWITQLRLILNRSIICIIRNYKVKLLELGTIMFLGIILSTPYLNLEFDTKAVQNWQGFWFSLVTNSIFQYCYTSIIIYQAEFSVVHREVSNNIYDLSVYYISQIIITFLWTILESLVYICLVFWIVGIEWEILVVTTFVLNMLTCRSYGSVLSAFFEKFENIVRFSLIYDYFAVAISGAYLSLGSLPLILYYLKYFSLFFLGCETLSNLQWRNITFIPCLDVSNCLRNGQEVLLSYGYDISRFNTDIVILGVFYVVSYVRVFGYYGLLRRTKKQPAY